MFNEPIANLLQMLALMMEIVGILLAAIEMRFPALERAIIEKSIGYRTKRDRLRPGPNASIHDEWLTYSFIDFMKGRNMWKGDINWVIGFPVFTWILLTVIFGLAALSGGVAFTAESLQALGLIYLLAPMVLFVFTQLLTYLASKVVSFSRNFGGERRLGSLGLVIAGIGLLLEAYQVLTILFTDSASIGAAPSMLKGLVATVAMVLVVGLLYVAMVARAQVRTQVQGETAE